MTETKQRGPFGGLSASEAARRSAESRASKARQAQHADTGGFRAKLRDSLDRMTQAEVDKLRKQAKPAELVRLAEAAYGKPTEESAPPLTRTPMSTEQRERLRHYLNEEHERAESMEESPLDAV